jgi:hypothetical protein
MEQFAHRCAPAAPSATERARARWGISRVRLLHETPEADLARALQRHLRHLPVVVLHDRLLPGGTPAAFLAIAPGGVTVVAAAAADLAGPLSVERPHGMFGARSELLRDGAAADRTALLTPLTHGLVAVRRLVGGAAGIRGALCLPEDAAPALHPVQVGDVLVGDARMVARLCAREGALDDTEVAGLVDVLHAGCPPVLAVG